MIVRIDRSLLLEPVGILSRNKLGMAFNIPVILILRMDITGNYYYLN